MIYRAIYCYHSLSKNQKNHSSDESAGLFWTRFWRFQWWSGCRPKLSEPLIRMIFRDCLFLKGAQEGCAVFLITLILIKR